MTTKSRNPKKQVEPKKPPLVRENPHREYAHKTMTPDEYGMWSYARVVSRRTGVFFGGKHLGTAFLSCGLRRGQRIVASLVRKGWLVEVGAPYKDPATGIWQAGRYRVVFDASVDGQFSITRDLVSPENPAPKQTPESKLKPDSHGVEFVQNPNNNQATLQTLGENSIKTQRLYVQEPTTPETPKTLHAPAEVEGGVSRPENEGERAREHDANSDTYSNPSGNGNGTGTDFSAHNAGDTPAPPTTSGDTPEPLPREETEHEFQAEIAIADMEMRKRELESRRNRQRTKKQRIADDYRELPDFQREQVEAFVTDCAKAWEWAATHELDGEVITPEDREMPEFPPPDAYHKLQLASVLQEYKPSDILAAWRKFCRRSYGFEGLKKPWSKFLGTKSVVGDMGFFLVAVSVEHKAKQQILEERRERAELG